MRKNKDAVSGSHGSYHRYLEDLEDEKIKELGTLPHDEDRRFKEAIYLCVLDSQMTYPLKSGPVNAAWKKDDFCSRIRNREAAQLLVHTDVLQVLNDQYFSGPDALNHVKLRAKSRPMGLLTQWAQVIVSVAMDMYTRQEEHAHFGKELGKDIAMHYQYHRHLEEVHAPAHLQQHYHVHDANEPSKLKHHVAAPISAAVNSIAAQRRSAHTPDPTVKPAHHRGAVKPRVAPEEKEEEQVEEAEPENNVLLDGWILKRSKKEKKDWLLRRAILTSDNILRFESEDHRPKGQIDMHRGIAIRHFNNKLATEEGKRLWDRHPYGFEIFCEAAQKAWYFDTRAIEKQTAWIKAVQYMIDYIEKQHVEEETYYESTTPYDSSWGWDEYSQNNWWSSGWDWNAGWGGYPSSSDNHHPPQIAGWQHHRSARP